MMAQSRSRSPIFFDLSSRVKLRVTGGDRVRFLQGQITNDIRKATEQSSIEACVLTAKGKTDAHFFVHADGEAFLIDADPALQSTLQPRLERYIIADDVTIEDSSARLSIFHVIGTTSPELPSAVNLISVNRFGVEGVDCWIDEAKHDAVATELSKTLRFCDEDCAEILRIENGIPKWGRELTTEIIPVEANLEERCIDYEKGCYIGQETISRMKMSGQRNKQLCGLVSSDGILSVGARLHSPGETKDIGWITSAKRIGERNLALGFVKRGFNIVGTKLHAIDPAGGTESVEIVDLPFKQ
jgi:folate-binding protein YgfZ